MPGCVSGKARKGSLMKKVILLISVVLFLYAYPGFAGEQTPERGVVAKTEVDLKQQIVRIRGYEGVSPLNLFIEPGTVVIWLNQYQGRIKITFLSKKVTLACKSPVNFFGSSCQSVGNLTNKKEYNIAKNQDKSIFNRADKAV